MTKLKWKSVLKRHPATAQIDLFLNQLQFSEKMMLVIRKLHLMSNIMQVFLHLKLRWAFEAVKSLNFKSFEKLMLLFFCLFEAAAFPPTNQLTWSTGCGYRGRPCAREIQRCPLWSPRHKAVAPAGARYTQSYFHSSLLFNRWTFTLYIWGAGLSPDSHQVSVVCVWELCPLTQVMTGF